MMMRWARLKFESISVVHEYLMVGMSLIVLSGIPCNVRVIDCSSRSSSSVNVSCLDIEDPRRDI